jgi:hypothetical protein
LKRSDFHYRVRLIPPESWYPDECISTHWAWDCDAQGIQRIPPSSEYKCRVTDFSPPVRS